MLNKSKPFHDLTFLIPLHTEIDWFESIQSTLSELEKLGATIIIGLNFPPKFRNKNVHKNPDFVYLSYDKYLAANQNWQELRKYVETSFFRYWFAGDFINIINVHFHLLELRNNDNLSFTFSCRGLRYKNFIFKSAAIQRFKYWGKTPRTIESDEILRSIQETGSNFIGEPSFVTFRNQLAPITWDASSGYAIELDYYYRCTEIMPARYVPGNAGNFGISVNSGTFKLRRSQYRDLITWIQPLWNNSLQMPLRKTKMKSVYFFRSLFLYILWFLEKLSFAK
jgi:hypothetical protein